MKYNYKKKRMSRKLREEVIKIKDRDTRRRDVLLKRIALGLDK